MEKQSNKALEIRKMSIEDVQEVYKIENQSFTNSSWSLEAFYHELEKNEFAHYFVVSLGEKIIGYCGIWIVIDQAQITTISVDESYRSNGIGQLLLEYVMNYASTTCTTMSLEVRIENKAARHVYEKAGFTYGGVRKNYYGDGEDAKVMWVSLKND
ncbi:MULTISPECIES: ribosomal protein S18-alanine N-acetyltransferase [Mammaliicoccus]|uniref:[Ribosomal protein bS18]-alanine N-acetyltransferase n=2 Tax=Mammaliicoccus fleurettii TaxID=150056 RepID=A0ABS5MN67_9STAP|nr:MULTISPECIES: ribosomal protein S18-alanine N-acetyltransferase [Mammaliicoccus]HCN60156.1 ribosomal-protein-alanine N-acetyltransferase [Staphylococcus sp.]MBL0847528.1 ribosomal protein S18-alanine N-acetyltransferase [Mammaliicoccus fleurettii]MBO3061971.1 ribosomal protein S18-alanine N-acetyltransferase [Mammaliicoccus fleurettii]MBS3672499.1 ribosomal protein S18-alanine N-acetyltransferase [Mammaliicoccus fleurettii]MBS3697368.1 ribosomal protein S18-alanine N-acetyltransferase [Mamm